MNFRPLHDRILARSIAAPTVSAGGIHIPETARDRDAPLEPTVLAVGNGKVLPDGSLRPLTIRPGDTIVFKKYSENNVIVDGDALMILREEDVLAVRE